MLSFWLQMLSFLIQVCRDPLRLIGLLAAICFVWAGPVKSLRRKLGWVPDPAAVPAITQSVGGAPIIVQLKNRSIVGRIGGMLATHTVLSIITGVLGFNVLMIVLYYVLAIPLWLMGAQVHLPSMATSGPFAVVANVKGFFNEKTAEIKEALGAGKAHAAEAAAEAGKKAAEALAEKRRQAAEAAERMREVREEAARKVSEARQAADEKVAALERAAAARVADAKALADKAAIVAKAADAMKSLAGGVHFSRQKSPEEVERQRIEAEWKSYRASERFSRMTLQEFANGAWDVEGPRLQRTKWRRWNAGYNDY
ncbi:MAG: hypothetical protein P4L85_14065 [Paludisphaera borealis]|uniref:hypothetical protein n=1 Tax=Paludisphaera borealis TaxID=1387353 RepID=UPI00283D4D1F|nr:hypothetical protein [Paludisphaera borealis]MDR3620472.1 hypothetical protein [Paludisphaera borealis]